MSGVSSAGRERQAVSVAQLGAARSDQLARVLEAGLVSEGRVFALSLSAIREQLGARWPARKDTVWETVEKALVKRMPAPDLFLRIDDQTILAAIASTDAYEGQARCAEVLRAVLSFFLGRSAEDDLGISRVSGLTDGQLTCEAIDLKSRQPLAPGPAGPDPATSGPARRPACSPDRWTPPLGGRRFDTPFSSERQGVIPLRIEVMPVWRLNAGIISAYAIRRRLPVRMECLTDGDREHVAQAVVAQLVAILDEYRREGGHFALLMPSAFSVLSATRSRLALLERCASVADLMRKVVLTEIDGFGPGVPAGRIQETAAMMRPFCHALVASVRDGAEAQAAHGEFAFHGMAIEASMMSRAQLDILVRSARRRTPNVMVHDVGSEADAERLRGLGASHVTFRPRAAGEITPGVSAPASSGPAALPAGG